MYIKGTGIHIAQPATISHFRSNLSARTPPGMATAVLAKNDIEKSRPRSTAEAPRSRA